MVNLDEIYRSMPEYKYYSSRKQYEKTQNMDDLAEQEIYENILRNEYSYSDNTLNLLMDVLVKKEN